MDRTYFPWRLITRCVFALVGITLIFFACKQEEVSNNPFVGTEQKQILLLDFEDDQLDTSLIQVKAAEAMLSSDDGVSHGKKALHLKLSADEKFTGFEFRPSNPIDARELGDYCFVFDATNMSEHSLHLQVVVENDQGETRRRSASIPISNTQTYYFELEGPYLRKDAGMRDNPAPWKDGVTQMKMRGRIQPTDFSKISAIRFYTKNSLFAKSVILDHIRLVETPPIPPDFLNGRIDKYGQNARDNFAGKIKSDAQLKDLANVELQQLAAEGPMSGRSRYGGWSDGPQLEATGFFRTEKMGGKWALVDPDGYLFFSVGIANVRMANTTTFTGIDFRDESVRYRDPEDVTPEDSRGMVALSEAVTNTAYVAYPWRYKMFEELPDYEDPLANHYSYRREQHFGPFDHGETFSFYQANLERRYGEPTPGAHLEKWVDVTQDRFLNWGFTSFGNWVGQEFFEENRLPYFANGWIIGDFKTVRSGLDFWGPMPDVFDPEFARRAAVTVQVVADEVQNNPWCIGVFIDNEKSWGEPGTIKGQYGIVLDALSMNASESPLKAEVIRLLQLKYRNIDALNSAWETEISDWASLAAGIDYKKQTAFSEAMVSDLSMLLEAYATKYFQVVHDALEEVLPNHLYLGCRFAPWGMGDEVRRAATKYVDVMSYNYYEEGIGKKGWTFLEEMDLPSIIGEFHIGTAAAGLFHHGVIHASDHEDRAKMYKDYLYSVIDNPYLVGAHWFQYIDSPVSGRSQDGETYNVGFVTNTDVPYPTLVRAAKEVNSELYSRRFGQ